MAYFTTIAVFYDRTITGALSDRLAERASTFITSHGILCNCAGRITVHLVALGALADVTSILVFLYRTVSRAMCQWLTHRTATNITIPFVFYLWTVIGTIRQRLACWTVAVITAIVLLPHSAFSRAVCDRRAVWTIAHLASLEVILRATEWMTLTNWLARGAVTVIASFTDFLDGTGYRAMFYRFTSLAVTI